MKPFDYARAGSVEEALAAGADGGRYIAGGTNLIDLMKLQVETPGRLVDISRLALDRVEQTGDSGVRIGALVTHAMLEDGPAAICCSGRAVIISTRPRPPATSATPAAGARRSMGSIASMQCSARRTNASRHIPPTWR